MEYQYKPSTVDDTLGDLHKQSSKIEKTVQGFFGLAGLGAIECAYGILNQEASFVDYGLPASAISLVLGLGSAFRLMVHDGQIKDIVEQCRY